MAWSVTKTFNVATGHRLSKHLGLCKNIHGHNLKIQVEMISNMLNPNDMVIDFYDLKLLVNSVVDSWDHTLFVNGADTENVEHAKTCGYRTLVIDGFDPTSEVLCKYLYDILKDKMVDNERGLDVKSIIIWESEGSCAKYWEDACIPSTNVQE